MIHNNMITPKEQLTKDREKIGADFTVEKAIKYPDLISYLYTQADTMYKFSVLNETILKQGI